MSEEAVRRFQTQQARVLAEVERLAGAAWLTLPAHREGNVEAFVAQITRTVTAGQLTMSRLVAALTSILTGEPVAAPAAEAITDVRGIALGEQYQRPFSQMWSELAKDPTGYAQNVTSIGRRVEAMATMDVQLATRNTMADLADRNPRIIGYRRVLTGKSCMFCAAASTRIYRGNRRAGEYGPASGLMPLHDHCDCGVAPVLAGADPGHALNRRTLTNLKAQGPDYWRRNGFVDPAGRPIDPTDIPDDLVVVATHDEIGPYLQAA